MFEQLLYVPMTVAVIGMVFSRSMVRSLLWLSVFSLTLTVKYFTLNAPDVAITEAALGTGLSTLVFLTAIRKTRHTGSSPRCAESAHGEPVS